MQPTYNPWIGYFDMIDKVDKFVFLDNVQLAKRSWQVRNRIKTPSGELMLTIPVKKKKTRSETILCKCEINDDEKWRRKHLQALRLNYSKARYFDEVHPLVQELIESERTFVADFNIHIIKTVCAKIGIESDFVTASDLGSFDAKKDALLAEICQKIGVAAYLSARGSKEYIERESPGGELVRRGIDLYYHCYDHPQYNQLHGDFVPFMGIFDLLYNEGFQNSLDIIRRGRCHNTSYKAFY
jgi:hypothetical protein